MSPLPIPWVMDICESCGKKTKQQKKKKKRGGLAPSLQTTEPATQRHSTIPAKNKQRRGTKAANKREVLRLLNWQVLPTYLLVPLFFFSFFWCLANSSHGKQAIIKNNRNWQHKVQVKGACVFIKVVLKNQKKKVGTQKKRPTNGILPSQRIVWIDLCSMNGFHHQGLVP